MRSGARLSRRSLPLPDGRGLQGGWEEAVAATKTAQDGASKCTSRATMPNGASLGGVRGRGWVEGIRSVSRRDMGCGEQR